MSDSEPLMPLAIDPQTAWRMGLHVAVEMLDGKARQLLATNSHRGKPHKRAAEDAEMLKALADRLWALRDRPVAEFHAGQPGDRAWVAEWFGEGEKAP